MKHHFHRAASLFCSIFLFFFAVANALFAQPSLDVILQGDGIAETATFKMGERIFTDRNYTLPKPPAAFEGLNFLRVSINGTEIRCVTPGEILLLTPVELPGAATLAPFLREQGFTKDADVEDLQLFSSEPINRVSLYRKTLKADETLELGKWCVVLGFARATIKRAVKKPWCENDGETLYNGIRLPTAWPPRDVPKDRSVKPVPYLNGIPKVLPIDVGRQLFVDDFLIESTTLQRQFHYPVKYEGNPVLKPETELELNGGEQTCATLFNDGVVYDAKDKLYKMWYHAGWFDGTAYAVSKDGLHWTRPELDVVSGTNRILPKHEGRRDGSSVFLDHDATDPAQRFKMFLYERPENKFGGQIFTSPDGVHWTFQTKTSPVGDNTTIFYNPFRKKWIYSVRTGAPGLGRSRGYRECDDLVAGARWKSECVHWASVDEKDVPDPWVAAMRPAEEDLQQAAKLAGIVGIDKDLLHRHAKYFYGDPTQLYNLDAAPYESLFLGVFSIHYGPENHICSNKKIPKTTELQLAYSRDGFHWDRPDRKAFIPATRKQGDWDFNYLHISSTVCTVLPDKIYFYYGAWSGESPKRGSDIYSGGAVGVAILRRDGFASMTAKEQPGQLTTRPVVFKGCFPFANVDTKGGELHVEILDEQGNVLPAFSKDRFVPVKADSSKIALKWNGTDDLSSLSGKPVRFRFHLTKGDLYAFWVSPEASGKSHGFVAGGGPDYPGAADE